MIDYAKLYSLMVSRVSSLSIPPPLLAPLLKIYCSVYGVDMESLPKPLSKYSSFREFFTRPLKAGARTIDFRPQTVISPVEGTLLEAGEMDHPVRNTFKIKGRYYTITEMLGKMSYLDDNDGKRKGFFLLYHLGPGSYHRIHSPVKGNVASFAFSPGRQYPVSPLWSKLTPDAFVKNARLTLKITSSDNRLLLYLVLIGALAVGDITLTYDNTRTFSPQDPEIFETHIPSIPVTKGQEIGIFNLGSSVFMICYDRSGAGMKLLLREGPVAFGSAVIETELSKQAGGNERFAQ